MNKIAIPSHLRSFKFEKGSGTIRYIPKEMYEHCFVAVHEAEAEQYLSVVPTDFPVLPIPAGIETEGNRPRARDYIIKYSIEQGYEKIIMLDDDLLFARRNIGSLGAGSKEDCKLTAQTQADFTEMTQEILDSVNEEFPIVGIRMRGFCSSTSEWETHNGPIIHVYGLHLPTIAKVGIMFEQEKQPYMADYRFILNYLVRGYKNKVLNVWTHDSQQRTTGGCKPYRTAELQSYSAKRLYKVFPDLVTVKWKNGKNWPEPFLDVNIKWKKAFNHGVS